jgi:U3 small nucleolar RNA-associated protein 18
VSFHPTLDLLLTAGFDKTLRVFRCDGDRNDKTAAAHLADLPVHAAAFVGATTDALCVATGRRPYFYTYDFQREAAVKVRARARSKDASLERFAASPDGSTLAFPAHDGRVLLCDARRGSWRPDELKMSGTARAACFGGDHVLFSAGGDAEVYEWDLRMSGRRCVARWADAGGSPCASLAAAGDALVVGTESGVVNVYRRPVAATPGFGAVARPEPDRAVLSLTTTVDTLAVGPDYVAVASRWAKDALRLVHLKTRTVAPNWPTPNTPIHYATSCAFNAAGSLVAVGNDRGRVLLYRLVPP